MQYRLQHIYLFLLLALPLVGFSQADTAQPKPLSHKDSLKHLSIKGKLYASAGIGQSTILWRVYGSFIGGYDPNGLTQSYVKSAEVDYGITHKLSFGAGIAYQTTSGIPQGNAYYTGGAIESTTRLNLTARILSYIYSTPHIQVYWGFRFGLSSWTDIVQPSKVANFTNGPAIGYGNLVSLSFQIPVGLRLLEEPFGIHIEAAAGTPYFIDAGLTLRI